MFDHLQIPYARERLLVGLADAALVTVKRLRFPQPPADAHPDLPRRILLLRLERVGDLIMVLDAIAMVRTLAPDAAIDLVVGSWNRALAELIPDVRIEILDVPWMARGGRGDSWSALVHRARTWRERRYDLAINFEPDIRSNLLMGRTRARRRVGFVSGGGGASLTDAMSPDPRAHIADNAKALVARAFETVGVKGASIADAQAVSPARLTIPADARRRAVQLIAAPRYGGPVVGIQPAAGRQIKEWDPARFAEVGADLARSRGATVVLIGSAADKPAVDAVRAAWPADLPLTVLPPDVDLVLLAAVIERLSLFVTGDTGPMHLAAAVNIPVLAIFGPSLPSRYAPLSVKSRIVRIDIPCSPCNLMRQPPARCVGHVPDCLAGISAADVLRVAEEMLDAS